MAKNPSTPGTKTRKKTTRKKAAKKRSSVSSTKPKEPAHLLHAVRGEGAPKVVNPSWSKKINLSDAKHKFIQSLAQHGNISLATASAGWRSRSTPYAHKEQDEEFAALWDEALEVSMDALELQARERAMGWEEPIFNKDGDQVGVRRVYSDKMAELLLKAHRPGKFRETVEHDVKHGGGVVLIPQPLSEEDFEKVAFDQQKRHREAIEHEG